MKTKIESLATFMAVAIWANGEYKEEEKVAIEEIAEAMELDKTAFNTAINNVLSNIKDLSAEEVSTRLAAAGNDVDDEEVGIVFECALQIVLADSMLEYDEVTNLLAIADALGLDEAYAVLMLADMLKEENDIEISFGEEE